MTPDDDGTSRNRPKKDPEPTRPSSRKEPPASKDEKPSKKEPPPNEPIRQEPPSKKEERLWPIGVSPVKRSKEGPIATRSAGEDALTKPSIRTNMKRR